MHAVRIVLMCIAAAVLYGVVHDQVTVRICLEYFTIGHPPIFSTTDPTLLALGWGVVATWWVGLLLGIPLAAAARYGDLPPRTVGSLLRPVAWLLAAMAAIALIAGIAGWLLAANGVVILIGPIAQAVPADRHVPFIANLWAHSASYLVGFVGGVILISSVWRSRKQIPDHTPI